MRYWIVYICMMLVACTPAPPQNSSGLVASTFDPNNIPPEITAFVPPSATPLALERCTPDSIQRAQAITPDYVPTIGGFITIQNNAFWHDDRPYPLYGINYYPRDYPNQRFLTEMDVPAIDFELDLIRINGINTLRIFIRYHDLFACEADGAIARPENLARLDEFIRLAGERGYKIIMVLHHDPDWEDYPLYDMPTHITQQTTYIVQHYADEPVIMAYDIRDSADTDFRAYRQQRVINWITIMRDLIREYAPNQLVTVSWLDDMNVANLDVDFISVQHFGDVNSLRQKIAIVKNLVRDKPIIISALGYATFEMDELAQRDNLYRAFEAIQRNELAGWAVWTAFDYPLTAFCIEPNCPAQDSPANRFGIWNTSYFPKRALDAIRLATGVAQEG